MKLKEVIVVEGKNDTQRLQRYFDVDTIETSGMFLSKEKLDLIKKINHKRGVILFLDPDSAGVKIRNRINDYIPNLKNAFIDKKKCRTTKKVGIEHASEEDLREALENIITYRDVEQESLSFADYIELGFQGEKNSKELRNRIGNKLFLGECNAKTLFKRLNMYQIEKEELMKLIEETYE